MSGKDFGKRLKELREAHHWSQPRLTAKSGVPTPTIANYEAGKVDVPGRDKIVALAAALDWPGGVDAALELAGQGPLSTEEHRWMPVPVELFVEVTEIWPQLSPRLQAALTELLRAICQPRGPMGHDPRNLANSQTISTPQEKPNGDDPVDHTRCEYR